MIELIRLGCADNDTERVRKIYFSAFPAEERRPWDLILNPAEPGCPALYGIYDDGDFKGFVTLWDLGRMIYVEHFAVDSNCRGGGIGGATLSRLKELAGVRPIVIEVEHENVSDEARRRVGFYRRHGFALSDYPYIQPPYDMSLPPVPMSLMSTGDVDYADVAAVLHRNVYKVSE